LKEPYNHSNLSAMDFQKFQMAGDFSAIQLVNILVHTFPHSTFLEGSTFAQDATFPEPISPRPSPLLSLLASSKIN